MAVQTGDAKNNNVEMVNPDDILGFFDVKLLNASGFQHFVTKLIVRRMSAVPIINKLPIIQQFDIESCLVIIFEDEW